MPQSLSSTAAALDRRIPGRRAVHDREVRLVIRPSFQPLWGDVLDVSVAGMGLLLYRTVEVGDMLAILLWPDTPWTSPVVRARVTHCTSGGGRCWLVGCCFDGSLSEEDLNRFFD
jgi:hypothetical protein